MTWCFRALAFMCLMNPESTAKRRCVHSLLAEVTFVTSLHRSYSLVMLQPISKLCTSTLAYQRGYFSFESNHAQVFTRTLTCLQLTCSPEPPHSLTLRNRLCACHALCAHASVSLYTVMLNYTRISLMVHTHT